MNVFPSSDLVEVVNVIVDVDELNVDVDLFDGGDVVDINAVSIIKYPITTETITTTTHMNNITLNDCVLIHLKDDPRKEIWSSIFSCLVLSVTRRSSLSSSPALTLGDTDLDLLFSSKALALGDTDLDFLEG